MSPARRMKRRRQAERLRREAESQYEAPDRDAKNVVQSDFAKAIATSPVEGFLPGYNFWRLPLVAAYIPGRRTQGRETSSCRALGSLPSQNSARAPYVYHEGSRYLINKVGFCLSAVDGNQRCSVEAIKVSLQQPGGYLHSRSRSPPGPAPSVARTAKRPAWTTLLTPMMRLQNVSTRRQGQASIRTRKSALRLGYETQSGFRFTAVYRA